MATVKWETNLETLESKAAEVGRYTDTRIYVDQTEDGLYNVYFEHMPQDKQGLSFFDAYYLLEGFVLGHISNKYQTNRRNHG